MRSRTMSTERLFGVSARLLAGASLLSTVGLGVAIRFAWQQTGQSYGPDGTPSDSNLPFAHHLILVVFDLNYRQVGVQLLLACALVGAAVVALHRNRSWEAVRLLRWEVLGAGLLSLVLVVALVVAHLYVMTASDDAAFGAGGYIGPQPVTAMILGNLITLGAALLVLTASTLWWLRLGAVDDPGDHAEESDQESDQSDEESDEKEVDGGAPDPVPASRSSSDRLVVEATRDYRHDWSPEDFRRPR